MRTNFWLPLLAASVISGSTFAQFAPYGNSTTTLPAQATTLAQAQAFLESTGENFAGITLTNADLTGNLPAASFADGSTIGIDFERLEAVVPPETPGAPGHPGCVVILVYHELQHLHHGWDRSYCSEIGITVHTAGQHCAFINWIIDNGGGPIDALCMMYNHVRNQMNNAQKQAEIAAAGCSGNNTIPPCGACPG